MTTFTGEAWSNPASDLSADDYCSVCLVDENESGADKVKDKCHLPIRSEPGGAVNKNALQAVSGVLMGARGGVAISADEKRAAAKKVVGLMRAAKMRPGDGLMKMAGMK